MKYSIVTLPCEDEKKVKLLARVVQSKAVGVSFTELTTRLQFEEFYVARGLSANQCDILRQQLNDLGAQYRVEQEKEEAPAEMIVPVPKPVIKVHPVTTSVTTKIEHFSSLVPEPPQKNRVVIPAVSILVIVATLLAIGLILLNAPERKTLEIEGVAFSENGTATPPSSEPSPPGESKEEKESRKYLDSADQKCVSGGTDTEQMYRFALSYNRNNKNAWFGLLNCFRSTGREEEASKIEQEMIKQFGENVLSPKLFPLEFGKVEVLTVSGSGASVVLLTAKENLSLYSDLFQLSRRYSAMGTYTSVRILVKRPDGTGLFLTLSPIGCMSYEEFSKNAIIEKI